MSASTTLARHSLQWAVAYRLEDAVLQHDGSDAVVDCIREAPLRFLLLVKAQVICSGMQ